MSTTTPATTIKMKQPIALLLKEIVAKRRLEAHSVANNQNVTAEAIRLLHKKVIK
jgi:hypothetical protein